MQRTALPPGAPLGGEVKQVAPGAVQVNIGPEHTVETMLHPKQKCDQRDERGGAKKRECVKWDGYTPLFQKVRGRVWRWAQEGR